MAAGAPRARFEASGIATRLAVLLGLIVSTSVQAAAPLPPSPYDILRSRDLETPLLDAVGVCEPEDLDPAVEPVLERARAGDWKEARQILSDWATGLDQPGPELVVLDAVLYARAAEDREDRLDVVEKLGESLTHGGLEGSHYCLRMELARALLSLERDAEAAAQLTMAERALGESGDAGQRSDAIAFGRAEILYKTGKRFAAHLAFRKLVRSDDPRIAAGARLRLTDLSFDSGKIEKVSMEYEALLPRASAFGGSTTGWALRAAEAALDVGDYERGLRWIELFLEDGPARDARDAAEIRLADLDARFEDPLRARKRLASVSGRRHGDRIGALAAVRAIDLGVSGGSPEQRVEILLRALREQRRGVRRYALGVLMSELEDRGDFDGALAVATRLAYEGIDPVVTPGFEKRLDVLLERMAGGGEAPVCSEVVRALGGRYGILIERASVAHPFVQTGLCFEELELPWLAVKVYRAITRRFGPAGAEAVTLPLARSSLAIGETTLARRVAQAALEDPGPDREAWAAVLAEADFAEGRVDEAAEELRAVLDSPSLGLERGKLIRLLALTLADRGEVDHVRFVAERAAAWLDAEDAGPAAKLAIVEAALLAAHAHRQAGRIQEARSAYRAVERHADPGALRSSARFWLGRSDPRGRDSEWGVDPEETLGSPWGRLALFERAVAPLSNAYRATGKKGN